MHQDENESNDEAVFTAMDRTETAHLAVDALTDGGAESERLFGLSEYGQEMQAEGASAVWAGKATGLQTGLVAANILTGPMAIVGGTKEVAGGLKAWSHGDYGEGTAGVLGGGSSIVSGFAGLASLGGSAAAAALGPALGALGGGVKTGHHLDEAVRERGWFRDDEGNAQPMSWESGQLGKRADAWTTKHLHSETLGTIAGLATVLGTSIGGVFAGSAAEGLTIGDTVAHNERAAGYSLPFGGHDGVSSLGHYDPVTGTVTTAPRGAPAAKAYANEIAGHEEEEIDATEIGNRRTQAWLESRPAWMDRLHAIARGRS